MTTFESLQERLSDLQEVTKQARAFITQLESCDPSNISNRTFTSFNVEYDGDCSRQYDGTGGRAGRKEDEYCASNLAAETLQLLEEQRDELEEIEEEILDLRERKDEKSRHEKARLVDGAKKAREGLRRTKLQLRTAQSNFLARARTAHLRYRDAYLAEVLQPLSSSMQNSASSLPSAPETNGGASLQTAVSKLQPFNPASEARRILPGGGPSRGKYRRPSDEADVDGAAVTEAVTSSLLRMHAAMSTSLERSSFAARMVEESSASLKQLGDHYDSLDSLLDKSKGLLTVLVRSAKTDAWYLQTSVYVLVGTLAWLIFRRWLYGPLWWLVWLPLRLAWGTGRTAVVMSGRTTGTLEEDSRARFGLDTAGQQVAKIDPDVPTIQAGFSEVVPLPEPSTDYQDDPMIDKVNKILHDANSQLPPSLDEEHDSNHESVIAAVDTSEPVVRDEL